MMLGDERWHARADPQGTTAVCLGGCVVRVGLPVVAFIAVGLPYEMRPLRRFEAHIEHVGEVVECYRITGEDAYLLKVAVADLEALREILDVLSEFGRAKASVVLSHPKRATPLRPRRHAAGRAGPRQGAD
ncbi:MAG: hypothetical protein GEU73_03020 [Chloroflexi bacterium]|nr:hypothetical protein [Chloroflexota bacterium]